METKTEDGTSRMEYKEKAPKFKMVIIDKKGESSPVTIIQGDDAMYMVNEQEKTALKLKGKNDPMAQGMTSYLSMLVTPMWQDYVAKHSGLQFTDKGKQDVNGVSCSAKEYKDPATGMATTLYVGDDNLIHRIESKGEGKDNSTIDIIDVQVNKDIPDGEFLPPAGYQIQDMSNMPGMPAAPGQNPGRE